AEMRYDLARRTYLPRTIHDIANKHPIPEALPLLIQMSNPDRPDRGGPQSGEGLAVANLAAVGGEYAITYLLMRAKAQPGTADAATNWEMLLGIKDPDLDFQLWESLNSESYTIEEMVNTCITNGSPWLRARAERAARHPTALYRY
ncbi:MAG: hypothetical protein R6X13_05950, partial [bacterium]